MMDLVLCFVLYVSGIATGLLLGFIALWCKS